MMKKIANKFIVGLAILSVFSCSNDDLDTTTETTVPADAGVISGTEAPATGEKVLLSVDDIQGAKTYRWYKDGEKFQDTETNEVQVTESGIYSVAGVNSVGEGKHSPDKTVTFDANKFMFYDAVASYEGGDYNKAYDVTLTTDLGNGKTVGVKIVFYNESPDDPNNIILPEMTYKSLWPYLNDYTAVGTVAPNDMFSLTGSYFFTTEDGKELTDQNKYFKNDGGSITVTKKDSIYTITGTMECIDADENSLGTYEFTWSGKLNFKNNWKEYNTYYFHQDDLDSDMDLGTVGAVTDLYYWGLYDGYTTNGHFWHFEMWQAGGDLSQPSYDIMTDFYTPAENGSQIPVGTFTIADEPRKGVPMTADRGYYYNDYLGTKMQHWDGFNYDLRVLAQPNDKSYIKIEKNNDDTYTVTVKIFDSLGHAITANYTGALNVVDNSQSSVPSAVRKSIKEVRRAAK